MERQGDEAGTAVAAGGGCVTAVCPSCGAPQAFGLLCSDDTDAMLGMLAAVPQLLEQLDVAVSRQAKVGNGGKAGKGSAHLRSPINVGAMEVRDELEAVAAIWGSLTVEALRRDPNVARGVVVLGRSVKNAYRAIDRAQERVYLGVCMYEEGDATCHAELWARPNAKELTCSQCGVTHDVAERRAWLLLHAADTICTVREASQWLGDVGGIPVTQDRIRGYVKRKRLTYRPGVDRRIRLGDLLDIVMQDSGAKESA